MREREDAIVALLGRCCGVGMAAAVVKRWQRAAQEGWDVQSLNGAFAFWARASMPYALRSKSVPGTP